MAALNARYSHTNLAVRSAAAYLLQEDFGIHPEILLWERTTAHRYRLLLRELAEFRADVVLFSCYIWNIALVRRLAADLRLLASDLILAAAGPEVCYCCGQFLTENPAFDCVVAGDEAVTAGFLRALAGKEPSGRRQALGACPAVFDRREPGAVPPAPPPLPLDALPFPYRDLESLSGRILYYESMRGCPFRCSYCLSSLETGPVRYRELGRVHVDLERFLAAGVRQVKFVDRTFNCDPRRAALLWRWLGEHDNGVTGFHFEVSGALLDEDAFGVLASLRPGLVQLEIGVQSANAGTLAAIHRPENLEQLFQNVRRLREPGNVHLHLDLIAGLPLEGYRSFACSFDKGYALGGHQLQLGFLKVLRGFAMERDVARYGIRYQKEAPYEVLCTDALSFGELSRLHDIADLVELYHNSGRFSKLLAVFVEEFGAGPFDFFEALADFWREAGLFDRPAGKVEHYEILGSFWRSAGRSLTPRHQWLCRYDMARHEKPKRTPDWVSVDGSLPHRERILAFYERPDRVERCLPALAGKEPKYVLKAAHLEIFPFHPETGAEEETALLFDYSRRDPDGRAAVYPVDA